MKPNSDDFQFKLYRVEYLTEVYETDQYGSRTKTIYSLAWPTREEAQKHLEEISVPHEYVKGRRVSSMVKHIYHDCSVGYREQFVQDLVKESLDNK